MLRFLLGVIVLLSIELALLVWLVHSVGWWVTAGIGLAMALLGASFAKRQGRRVWRDWRMAATSGHLPELDALDPMLVLAGSVLLMFPGLLTDAVGLLLLIPGVRRNVARRLRPWVARRSAALIGSLGTARSATDRPERAHSGAAGPARGAVVVDTEGEVVTGGEGPPVGQRQLR
jgi:UPF0716 protein FxsA